MEREQGKNPDRAVRWLCFIGKVLSFGFDSGACEKFCSNPLLRCLLTTACAGLVLLQVKGG